MNSTGKGLSCADLVRNFVLMDFPITERREVHHSYWRQLEVVLARVKQHGTVRGATCSQASRAATSPRWRHGRALLPSTPAKHSRPMPGRRATRGRGACASSVSTCVTMPTPMRPPSQASITTPQRTAWSASPRPRGLGNLETLGASGEGADGWMRWRRGAGGPLAPGRPARGAAVAVTLPLPQQEPGLHELDCLDRAHRTHG